MTLEAWFTVGTIVLIIAALVTNRIGADVAMVGGLTLLLIGDFVLPRWFGASSIFMAFGDAIGGFAHPAVLMIAALFVVAAGLQETGGMEAIAQRVLGRPKTITGAQLRLMAPVAFMSAFMNNTPIVAAYLPIVNDWARKLQISPSKLFMPLSFAAILGGKITYIGTASNITIMLLYLQYVRGNSPWLGELGVAEPTPSTQFWGIACLGIPTTVAGITFILLMSRWLLPTRKPADSVKFDARRYQVEMIVKPESPIVGKTIEEAGLRHLRGLYVTQIERHGDVLTAVGPDEQLQSGDRLGFVGVLESVVDLRKIRGLEPATDQVEKVAADRQQRTLVEAVVSRNSPLVGQTIRTSQFRTVYNAAIIAVYRDGQHINAKIGDIGLQPGDTLLLDTHGGFVKAYRNSGDFYLVSSVEGTRPIRHERSWIAFLILGALVFLLTATRIPPVTAALFCAMAMVGTRCITGTVARSSINWQVLIVIGAALGLGEALTASGAAGSIASYIMDACKGVGVSENPHAMLFVIFMLTAISCQLITNNGAAVLMFPIAMETARCLGAGGASGVNPEPFVFCLMVAAGSSFMSPVAYQTNLMVYGPGGYRFLDYARLGAPLTVLLAIICTLVAPMFFPFRP